MNENESAERRGWAFDVVVALLLVLLNLSLLLTLSGEANEAGPIIAALVVAHAGCLAWRRRAPLIVFSIVAATGATVIALGYPSVVLGVAVLVAIYTVASIRERAWSLPTMGVAVAVSVLSQIPSERAVDVSTIVGNAVVMGVMWFLGDSVRQRRDYVARLEERTAELELARDELARAAVVQERLRISRELHDILGHSVSLIAVQAGVGAHVIDSKPDEAKRSLEAIESVSRSALVEIRQVVGALRDEGDSAGVSPAPGLADLSRLVSEVPDTIVVDLDVSGAIDAVPTGPQLTIYRVVQEALTNVIRHSGATRARVTVRVLPQVVRVEIVDDGSGSAAASEGHGLDGMRERVTMHEGELTVGPLAERGFRVSATLPIGARR